MHDRAADQWICAMLGAIALVASVGFYSFPLTEVPIGVDSAVFSYVGEAMARGGAPYVDVFDHKGPLVYLVNLLATMGPSTWVLWIIEWLFLAVSLCLGYRIGRIVGAPRLAAAAVSVLIVPYIVYRAEGGNMTEEYALPFMLATMLVVVRALKGAPLRTWHALAMGACSACVFMLRFTELVGLLPLLVVLLAVLVAKRKVSCALKRAGQFAIGFAAVAGAFAAWLAAMGSLSGFAEQYFAFNIVYAANADAGGRLGSLAYFASDPALVLAVAATGAAMLLCWANKRAKCGRDLVITAASFAGLALLFALAGISGRSYGHYSLMFVPFYFVAYNVAVVQVGRAVENRAAFAVAGTALLLAGVYLPASYGSLSQLAYRTTLVDERAEVVRMLKEQADGGAVLAVGNECWVYLDGGFNAPTPYAYRSDVMASEYDDWLGSLVSGDSAPKAIVVADYVEIGADLGSYDATGEADGFTVYARR